MLEGSAWFWTNIEYSSFKLSPHYHVVVVMENYQLLSTSPVELKNSRPRLLISRGSTLMKQSRASEPACRRICYCKVPKLCSREESTTYHIIHGSDTSIFREMVEVWQNPVETELTKLFYAHKSSMYKNMSIQFTFFQRTADNELTT